MTPSFKSIRGYYPNLWKNISNRLPVTVIFGCNGIEAAFTRLAIRAGLNGFDHPEPFAFGRHHGYGDIFVTVVGLD